MKKYQVTFIINLQNGDRFYSASDKSKKTFCMVKSEGKIYKIDSNKADRLGTVERCIPSAFEIKRNIEVVYLRSTDLPYQQIAIIFEG